MSNNFKINQKETGEILSCYPTKRAALLPVLWHLHDKEGYISNSAIETVAEYLGLSPADVLGTVSFYAMFQRKPIGKHHIQICNGVCCRLRGSEKLINCLKEKLSIEVGQTTSDGKFHLSTVECLGSCGSAPMMQVGNTYHENLDEEKVTEILLLAR